MVVVVVQVDSSETYRPRADENPHENTEYIASHCKSTSLQRGSHKCSPINKRQQNKHCPNPDTIPIINYAKGVCKPHFGNENATKEIESCR